MADIRDQISYIFIELQELLAEYGPDEFLRRLRRVRVENDKGYEDNLIEYILTVTANHYKVPKDDIVYSKKRGMITDARRICFALMKEHMEMPDDKIGIQFNGRSRQYINRELNDLPINQDKFATKDEARFVSDFINLTTQVQQYKNEYKLKKIPAK